MLQILGEVVLRRIGIRSWLSDVFEVTSDKDSFINVYARTSCICIVSAGVTAAWIDNIRQYFVGKRGRLNIGSGPAS
jgi:hypothetical protein